MQRCYILDSICRRTLIVFLILGLTLQPSLSKTLTEPCEGENCAHKSHLDPTGQSHENVVERMAQAAAAEGESSQPQTGEIKDQNEEQPTGQGEKQEGNIQQPVGENIGGQETIAQPTEGSDANKEERQEIENKEHEQKSHNIDPDAVMHSNGDAHAHKTGEQPEEIHKFEPNAEKEMHGGVDDVHGHRSPPIGDAHAQKTGEQLEEIHKFEPNAEKEMHGGVDDVHGHRSPPIEEEAPGESGPDADAILHGGDAHVHSADHSVEPMDLNAQGQFGVDPEGILHDGAHVHAHGGPDGTKKEGETASEGHDFATDIDAILHGGDKHAHSADATKKDTNDIPEVPIGATDPEAMLHNGGSHVHTHARPSERTDQKPRPYGVQDPESALHGADDAHGHTIKEAMEGSRPLPSTKDPDEVTFDVDPRDIKVGTLRPEDTQDYREWKTEKQKQAETKESTPDSWFPGFSYLKDTIWRDLQAVKKRYLAKLWDEDEASKETDGSKTVRNVHDEP